MSSKIIIFNGSIPISTHNLPETNSSSSLLISPSNDSRVKVTRFSGLKGDYFPSIFYSCDETVYLRVGKITIKSSYAEKIVISAGGVFHVPAGSNYALYIEEDCEALCLFSAGKDGVLPDET